ncbi:hypothetical protein P153DRAFT_362004 [Dothidotthia symphoricarpi CBS 119687]|uniref:Uncharacterized protein n=1 Tax=Dothidotthia symphoricarpi CBS 119687 TaxID=1392245 RepID=A0A6A5ZUW2_9PLEO|nr:uncharacterized protein P153DRAFT_362004 [Dothidotthia symphoricarpi CBS 119687]KAF2123440.1 hypothetical protein P153DRAFT_362004 [Dothidotthia symphoricarpi CBS 119687]
MEVFISSTLLRLRAIRPRIILQTTVQQGRHSFAVTSTKGTRRVNASIAKPGHRNAHPSDSGFLVRDSYSESGTVKESTAGFAILSIAFLRSSSDYIRRTGDRSERDFDQVTSERKIRRGLTNKSATVRRMKGLYDRLTAYGYPAAYSRRTLKNNRSNAWKSEVLSNLQPVQNQCEMCFGG